MINYLKIILMRTTGTNFLTERMAATDMSHSATTQFAIDLIGLESVTPSDAGCQEKIAERLRAAGYRIFAVSVNGREVSFVHRP